jgi:hypothetical protein
MAALKSMSFTKILQLTKIQLGSAAARIYTYIAGLLGYDAATVASTTATTGFGAKLALLQTGLLNAFYRVVTYIAGLIGYDTATVSASLANFGFVTSLVALITGEEAATVATWSLRTALWETTVALLTNPLTWVVIGIAAATVAVYQLGKAWGWWNDLSSMGSAILTGLTNSWNTLVRWLQQAYVALTPLGNAILNIWNMFWSSPLPSIISTIGILVLSVFTTGWPCHRGSTSS